MDFDCHSSYLVSVNVENLSRVKNIRHWFTIVIIIVIKPGET